MARYRSLNPVQRAERYCAMVSAGDIEVGKYARLAVERHMRDLARVNESRFPYKFDEALAMKPCLFIEELPHVKGQWAKRGELITLSDWQCFIVCCLFGWIRKKDLRRRFREAYLEIPRKNGKSVLAAGIGLYMFCMDGEFGAEVYSGATSEKQAWEVFRPALAMMSVTEDLREEVGAELWAKSMTIAGDGSRFEPVIGKPGDGSSPHCAIADEFHEHETPDQVDTMQTGMGAREQPLMLKITTSGNNLVGPCYDTHCDAKKVLERVLENEEMFAIIYGIDEEDDWTSPKILAKANPNYGVSVDHDFLIAQQRQAVLNPIHQNRFKTKHLNVWCSARTAWMPLASWQLCADEGLVVDDFIGSPGWFILDLASKDDIAVFGKLFRRKINRDEHYYWFPKFYIPENALNDEENPNAATYRKWHRQGFLHVTDGAEIDFDVIKDDVIADRAKFQVKELLYDPWRATQLAHQLAKSGAVTVELRQTVQNLSAPMKEVLAAVRGGRMHHDGNPVMMWMVSNVTAKLDAKDNIYPRKEKPQMKIDGAVALIMGMARGMVVEKAGIDGWLSSVADGVRKDGEEAKA